MHVVFRENHGLDANEQPQDLGQSPAELVVLSLSDSDLGAFAEGWHQSHAGGTGLPKMRLANLSRLKHPLSVDTYMENTLSHARGVLIRLIGGVPYWSYGLQQLRALAQRKGIAVAVLPADGRDDPQLAEYSTLPQSTLKRLKDLCDIGGPRAARAALAQLSLAAGIYAKPVRGAKAIPDVGAWTPKDGPMCGAAVMMNTPADTPRIAITFYRSFVVAADTKPIAALKAKFEAKGYAVQCLFVPSLKAPNAARWLRRQLAAWNPVAVVNTTSFSGKGKDGTSPLDELGVPVFQTAIATNPKKAWADGDRGLSPADLAMHVVLPEVDGRIFTGVASFKETSDYDRALEFSRVLHEPVANRIDHIVQKVHGWVTLATKAANKKRLGIVLSTYPGKPWQMAHAVGLDALQSTEALLDDLRDQGYRIGRGAPLAEALGHEYVTYDRASYEADLAKLPKSLVKALDRVWGPIEDDPLMVEGQFYFKAAQRGHAVIALQPERGDHGTRVEDYHDLERVPRHSYVAFYLWLRKQFKMDAMLHIGAHGTLEWLPGKAVALSNACWPEALIGTTPVIYPFIVNDPGEAAQAKRRISAVTIGHAPPPLAQSETPLKFAYLEALLDEFSNADGLDPKRREGLIDTIREEARATGLEDSLGLPPDICTAEAITRIDRFVCDIKETQFGEGLHVYGRANGTQEAFDLGACAQGEQTGLMAALGGRMVAAGPAGSPYRGREDVTPTGRNLFSTDPRVVPTKAAYRNGVRLGEELIRRHLQDNGDYPSGLIVDLWGSATMRTAGEEFAMALHLIGARPIWDQGSERVSGFEILPLAELDRPRIDVTLRVSGLFRDIFPNLSSFFNQAIKALAARDEASDFNPFVQVDKTDRVYGPKPGMYGLGMSESLDYSDSARQSAAEAWLAASAYALNGDQAVRDDSGIAARVQKADSFVHLQDMRETDILLSFDYAAHEGGFAAAKEALSGPDDGKAALYHMDTSDPIAPKARALSEEIARIVHGRASNATWLTGMQKHGFRGAAEIAATLDHLAAFAHLARNVPSDLIDAYFDATLDNDEIATFLRESNKEAYDAMWDQFRALRDQGLWTTRRNSILARLEGAA